MLSVSQWTALIVWNAISVGGAIAIISTVLRRYFGLHIIGLTGGIASGKSTCCRFFTDNSSFCHVIDFDDIAHAIYACGTPTWSQIRLHFPDVLNKDHTIDRKALGRIVWSDRQKLNLLMSMTRWPIFKEFLIRLCLNILYCRTQILDVPLLIEHRLIRAVFCDCIILVYCDRDTQMVRLMRRDGIDPTHALQKMDKQMHIEEKRKLVCRSARNIVVDNTKDVNGTQWQLQQFMSEHQHKIHSQSSFVPTKLSLMISTAIFAAGYLIHSVVLLF